MFVNNDNSLVFSILERSNKLPLTFKKDSVYCFEQDGSFYLVMFFAAKEANRFLLFTIVRFKTNFAELNDIITYLMDMEVKKEEKAIIEEALTELNTLIANGRSAETMFFDAH